MIPYPVYANKISFSQKNLIIPTNLGCGIRCGFDIIIAMGKKRSFDGPVRPAPARRVVVALRMAGIAGQDKLNGIFSYLNEGHRWSLAIYRTQHEFSAEAVRAEIARGADGFIVGLPGTDGALDEIAKTDLPAVLLSVPGKALMCRRGGVAMVKSNAREVGMMAADALLSQGIYRCYGYVGYRTDDDWSRERGRAFRDTLDAAGFVTRMYDLVHFRDKVESREHLAKWLMSLPKPCGILAACDDRAYDVIDVCVENGIKIPADVGLLGVNNDPLLCENISPTLSSVQPDFKEEGRLGAEILERLMARRRSMKGEAEQHLVGVKAIVHRETTFPLSNAGKLVQKAMAFIAKNASRKIGVPDVIRHLKVSRSLAGLRFRELQHQTIYDAIVAARLEEVRRRLVSTHDTIEQISTACGWQNANALKNLFKRRFGMSMRDYRNHPISTGKS